jgi:hypothetical protein
MRGAHGIEAMVTPAKIQSLDAYIRVSHVGGRDGGLKPISGRPRSM